MSQPSVVQVLPPTFEQHHNGFGIQCSRPRISWRFSCSDEDVRDWEQCAYDIEIQSVDSDGIQRFHVENQQSVLVPWPEDYMSLKSRDRRQVRVRCYGTSTVGSQAVDIAITEWSEWSCVEAALLDRLDWQAKTITPADTVALNEDGSVRPLCFRKTFKLPNGGKIARARLYITGYGAYQAYVNGENIGDDCMAPGWQSYDKRLHYQVFDVASALEIGEENIIGVEVGPGWYASAFSWAHRRFTYGGELGTLAQLEVAFQNGSETTICSDNTWKYFTCPIISSEIYAGEVFDQNIVRDLNGWNTFTTFNDRSWWAVKASSLPVASLISPNAPPVRITQRIMPTKIFQSPSGKTLIDFGQNLVGRLHVRRLRKPTAKVIFRHAEVLENGELCTRPLRGAKATDTIICNGDLLEDWTPKFTFHGFRYVEVTGWSTINATEPLTVRSLFAEVMHSDMQQTGWFSCSNEDINKIHDNARWSMRGNFFSVPTDCPQRDERMGWTGDLNVFTPSANFLYNTAGILGNWLEDLYADQMDESEFWKKGVVPFVVPNCIRKQKADDPFWDPTPNAVWADVTVMMPWELYQAFGDIGVLQRQYESMKAYLQDGISYGEDGLWDEQQWQFGDWLDPSAPTNDSGRGRTDATYVADAFLLHVINLMSLISSVLGRTAENKAYSATHNRIQKAFVHKYLTPYGLTAPDTPTALSLALHFSLIPTTTQRRHAAARLARHLRLNPYKIPTGFAGTPSLLQALTYTGNVDLLYAMLLEKECPSFLYPVTMGATTIWERWNSMLPDGSVNPGSMTSFNHYALGSVVAWLYSCVGGISALEPGWKTFLVRPVVPRHGELSSAEVVFEGRYGRVEVRWMLLDVTAEGEGKKTGKDSDGFADVEIQTFRLVVLVPPNSRAKVVMPDRQKATYLEDDEAETGVWVGSGRHVFDCMLAKGGSR